MVEGGGVLLIAVGEPGGVAELPLLREPGIEVALGPGGEVHEQLRQVELWIQVVPAAGGSQAGKQVARRLGSDEARGVQRSSAAFHLESMPARSYLHPWAPGL